MINDLRSQVSKLSKWAWVFSTLCLLGAALSVLPACSKHRDSTAHSQATRTLYHCAMHPQIVSDRPGECPICHMTLVAFQSDAPSAAAGQLPDQAPIHLAPGVEQRIGVTVAPVEKRALSVPIRAAARVAYDPQLFSASLEHQEAVKFLKKAREQGAPDLLEQAQATVRSSELRLRQMGLSDAQIADIEKPGYNASALLVGSRGGSVWVYIDAYDAQASMIRPGQAVELTSPALPGRTFSGTVRSMDPVLNADSRTLRVRAQVTDPDGALKPEMYLSAMIEAGLGRRLAIPESAVMDTGTRQLAYVQTEPGTYEPREIRLGHQADGYDEVVSGLREGEKVATSANFLIDSESRIQAATEKAMSSER